MTPRSARVVAGAEKVQVTRAHLAGRARRRRARSRGPRARSCVELALDAARLWRRRATWTRSRCGGSSGDAEARHHEARAEERHVEALAVERDEHRRLADALARRARASGASSPRLRTRSCSTTRPPLVGVPEREPHEERDRARAAGEARRLGVEVERARDSPSPRATDRARGAREARSSHPSRDAGARPVRCAGDRRRTRRCSGPSGVSSARNGRRNSESSAVTLGCGRGPARERRSLQHAAHAGA